jgi:hypothetical protein
MFKKLQFVPFILGLTIGLFVVYLFPPEHETVVRYPTPAREKEDIYRDKNGVCYNFTSEEVNCDNFEDKLRDFPLQ